MKSHESNHVKLINCMTKTDSAFHNSSFFAIEFLVSYFVSAIAICLISLRLNAQLENFKQGKIFLATSRPGPRLSVQNIFTNMIYQNRNNIILNQNQNQLLGKTNRKAKGNRKSLGSLFNLNSRNSSVSRAHTRIESLSPNSNLSTNSEENLKEERKLQKYWNSISFCFLLCWLPYCIFHSAAKLSPTSPANPGENSLLGTSQENSSLNAVDNIFTWIAILPSCINPIIFSVWSFSSARFNFSIHSPSTFTGINRQREDRNQMIFQASSPIMKEKTLAKSPKSLVIRSQNLTATNSLPLELLPFTTSAEGVQNSPASECIFFLLCGSLSFK